MEKRHRKLDEESINKKLEKLKKYVRGLERVLIAFSGGTDSTLLLAIAHDVLGDNVLAATDISSIHPSFELETAKSLTNQLGIEHILFITPQLDDPQFVANTPQRCYYCKKLIVNELKKIAKEKNISHIAHGANMDDLRDYRPGMAAADEMGVLAPLVQAGLNKEEIRFMCRKMGLTVWNRPSMACLATRIPYGHPVTSEKLQMVDNAEAFLRGIGFLEVRVRHYGDVGVIELGVEELARAMEPGTRSRIIEHLKSLGFKHISLDLEGYLSGKMNRSLE